MKGCLLRNYPFIAEGWRTEYQGYLELLAKGCSHFFIFPAFFLVFRDRVRGFIRPHSSRPVSLLLSPSLSLSLSLRASGIKIVKHSCFLILSRPTVSRYRMKTCADWSNLWGRRRQCKGRDFTAQTGKAPGSLPAFSVFWALPRRCVTRSFCMARLKDEVCHNAAVMSATDDSVTRGNFIYKPCCVCVRLFITELAEAYTCTSSASVFSLSQL